MLRKLSDDYFEHPPASSFHEGPDPAPSHQSDAASLNSIHNRLTQAALNGAGYVETSADDTRREEAGS